ncbi:MAG: nuclear transport factor 2 family protein [Coriobacteriales bacterium]|jgi:predicted SnoaL-like aldol condensation-catalyzing enzyme
MSKQMENAKNLYIRGIEQGNIKEVQDNYMGDTYTQHSTGVPDGKDGFRRFFEDFFKRNPKRKMNIVRSLEDGNLVFLHVHQYLNDGAAQWITTDIFESDDDGRIVEHWDVIDAYPQEKTSVDPIYGEFHIEELGQAEDNKKAVRRFLVDIMQNKDLDLFDRYVSPEMVNHCQSMGQGGKAYRDYLVENNVSYEFVFKVMGQGDYVVAYSKVRDDGNDYAQFDIFRLEDGRIAEYWNNREPIPRKEELTNLGKF